MAQKACAASSTVTCSRAQKLRALLLKAMTDQVLLTGQSAGGSCCSTAFTGKACTERTPLMGSWCSRCTLQADTLCIVGAMTAVTARMDCDEPATAVGALLNSSLLHAHKAWRATTWL